MAFPPSTIASDKANNTAIVDDHPAHHNAIANAINDTVSEVQTWTVNRAAGGKTLHNLGAISVGHNGLSSGTTLVELGGSTTVTDGGSAVMMEFGEYDAEFTTTDGGTFIGIHITPQVTGSATVAEVVGVQSQVTSAISVTSQIHAQEALVNFGGVGKTAALSRCVWAQTVCALGTITDAIGVDVNGNSSGLGTITTMYGVRVGRTSGALALQGSTIYGVYVNQGSVRNYFGGDTQFGGGSNGTWGSNVLEVDSSGVSATVPIDVTGSSARVLVGVASHASSLNPDVGAERSYTITATSSNTGVYVGGTRTFTTNSGSSFSAVHVAPGITASIGMSAVTGYRADFTASSGSSNTVTDLFGGYIKATSGANLTSTTARGVYSELVSGLGTITTGVVFDGKTTNSFGTFTTAIGLRLTQLDAGSTKWGMQVGDYQSYHHGMLSLGGTSAPGYGLDLLGTDANRGVIRFAESTATPNNPSSSTGVLLYHKADKLVAAFNNAGTMLYWTLDLTAGASQSWVRNTTAP